MATSAMSKEMLDYFNRLSKPEQKSILEMLKTFLNKKENTDTKLSMEDYTKELLKADEDIDAGEFVLHEDVVKYFGKK